MSETFTGFAYLAAAVFFILALRGLSSPESARKGNILGVVGMVIAIATTLVDPKVLTFDLIITGMIIGGLIGSLVAIKINMTALPQLVAAFHSLVGLAAVFVAVAAFFAPEAYGIGVFGNIQMGSLVEMSLGAAIGAITFSGSLVAFCKLQGVVGGSPFIFKGQHALNALLAIVLVLTVVWLVKTNSELAFWLIVGLSIIIGFTIIDGGGSNGNVDGARQVVHFILSLAADIDDGAYDRGSQKIFNRAAGGACYQIINVANMLAVLGLVPSQDIFGGALWG